ncbi:MAG: large-conductance mechanosensitive channel protein MscL [Bacteriovoracaceae bacterium]
MLTIWKEFKEFTTKGNVIDLAVGIIIGASFGRIVTSLVQDIIMPPIGLILGKVDFSNLYLNLSGGTFENLKKAKDAGAVTINYGLFINNIIDFIVVALAIFLLVRYINKLKQHTLTAPTEASAPTLKECEFCFKEIAIKATRCPHCTSNLSK